MRRTLRRIAAALLVALLVAQQLPAPNPALADEGAGSVVQGTATDDEAAQGAGNAAQNDGGKSDGGAGTDAGEAHDARSDATADDAGEAATVADEESMAAERTTSDMPEPPQDGEDEGDAATPARATAKSPTRAPSRSDEGRAYAVYDDFHRALTLVRSNDVVADGTQATITDITGTEWSGTVWGGIEELEASCEADVPWYDPDYETYIRTFSVADGCVIRPRSCAWWFYPARFSLGNCSLAGLDTSGCTSFAHMFGGCSCLRQLDVTPLDTSAATDMTGMFAGCTTLESLDCSGFVTSRVTKMGDHQGRQGTFSDCWALASLDISGFDTSKVTDLSGLFGGCYVLDPIPAEHIDTSSATNLSFMFSACRAVRRLDLSHFDTSGVSDMTSMLAGCTALEWLDISSFDTGNVTAIRNMFSSCDAVREMTLGPDFSFAGAGIEYVLNRAMPPIPPFDETYNCCWVKADDETVHFLPSSMRDEYDGATMAGTYVWEVWHSCPLTLDLAGGSTPEGQEYPTEYPVGTNTYLPGTDDSELDAPTRRGYRFLYWTDEEGNYIERIDSESRGQRTVTAKWYALQIRVRVPVAETLVATQAGDGELTLVPEDGDFSLVVQSTGNAPVEVSARATAAEGFAIADEGDLADAEADVWMTPVSAAWNAGQEGYDPASDQYYQEHDEVRLSQMGEAKRVGPRLSPYGRFFLNKVGGRMGGWSANDGSKRLLATIEWTFALASDA